MDWTEIYFLLNIVEKCQGHPNLSTIRDKALAQLKLMNDSHDEEEGDGA